MKEIKKKINLEEIAKTDAIDYDGIDDFPLLSFLHLYDKLGVIALAEKYADAKKDLDGKEGRDSIAVADHIFTNFTTMMDIKHYITENWERYNLDIKKDNEVIWKENKSRSRQNFRRNLSKHIGASLIYDVANYGPGLDEELEDGEIVFRWEEEEINLE